MADETISTLRSVPPPSALDRFSEAVCGFPCAIRGCRRFEEEQSLGKDQPTGIPPRQVPRNTDDNSRWLVFTLAGSKSDLIVFKSRQTNNFLAGKNYIEWCFVDPKPVAGTALTPPDYQEAAAWENGSHIPISSAQKLYAVFGDHLFSDQQIVSDDNNIRLSVTVARPSNLISSSFSQTAGCHFEQYNESLRGLRAFVACAVEASLHDPIWDNTLVSISYLHQDQLDGRRVVRWLPFHGDGFPRNDEAKTNAALDALDFSGLNGLLKTHPIAVKRNQASDAFTFADAFSRNQKLLLSATETTGGFIQVSRGEWLAFSLYWLILRTCLWNESFRKRLEAFVGAVTQESLSLLLGEVVQLPFSSLFAYQSPGDVQAPSDDQAGLLVFTNKSFGEILSLGLKFHSLGNAWSSEEANNAQLVVPDGSENLLDAVEFLNEHFSEKETARLHELSGLPMYRDLGWKYIRGEISIADAIAAVSHGLVESLTQKDRTAPYVASLLNERLDACYTKNVIPVLPLLHQWVCDLNLRQYITIPITEAQLDPGGVPIAVAWAHIMTPLNTEEARLKATLWARALSTASAALAGVISSDQAASREVDDDISHTLKSKADSIKRLSTNLSEMMKPDVIKGLGDEVAIVSKVKYLVKESERMSNLVEVAHLLRGSSMDSIDRVLADNHSRRHLFTEDPSNFTELIFSLVNEFNQGRNDNQKEIKLPSMPNIILKPCIASQGKVFHFSRTLIEHFVFEVLDNTRNRAVGPVAVLEMEFDSQTNSVLWRNRANPLDHTEWQKPARRSSGLGSFDQLLKRFEAGRIETRSTVMQDDQGARVSYFELRMTIKGLTTSNS